MTWHFGNLTPMSFDFVMVDFPWRFEAWSEAGKKRNIRTAFLAPIGRHSEKPAEAYHIAERMMPQALRRADIFSRRTRPGWTAWGDEAGKFDSEAA